MLAHGTVTVSIGVDILRKSVVGEREVQTLGDGSGS